IAVGADAADLAGVALHDRLAEADLAVAGDHDLAALAHRHDRRGVHGQFIGHRVAPISHGPRDEGLSAARALRGWLRHMYAGEADLQMPGSPLETKRCIATGNRPTMLLEG